MRYFVLLLYLRLHSAFYVLLVKQKAFEECIYMYIEKNERKDFQIPRRC